MLLPHPQRRKPLHVRRMSDVCGGHHATSQSADVWDRRHLSIGGFLSSFSYILRKPLLSYDVHFYASENRNDPLNCFCMLLPWAPELEQEKYHVNLTNKKTGTKLLNKISATQMYQQLTTK